MENALQQSYHNRISPLIYELNQRLIERDELSRLVVLAMLSKQHMFLIGERGVAKSMTVELVNGVIKGSTFWQLQVNDDTKLEELFGEKRSTEDGTIAYASKSSVLNSNYVVLDEMFKAKGDLLNGLLELLVDGTFTSGDGKKKKTPLVSVFGTSNEYPTETRMLPFVDRFMVWYKVNRIQDPENRKRYYAGEYTRGEIVEQYFSLEDVDSIKSNVQSITVPPYIIDLFDAITSALVRQAVKTSDRKYERVLNTMIKTSAYLNNRSEVDTSDLFLLLHTAWHDEHEKDKVFRVVFEQIFGIQEEIAGYLVWANKRVEEIDAYKNGNVFDYLHYKIDIEGNDKNALFSKILGVVNEVYDAYSEVKNLLQNLKNRYRENLNIEQKLEENLFLYSYKQNAFTQEMINTIQTIEASLLQKMSILEVWYSQSGTLFDYQNCYSKKQRGEKIV